MSAPEPFGPIDPYKYARRSGHLEATAWQAAQALRWGEPDKALGILREALELIDPAGAAILWPMEKAA